METKFNKNINSTPCTFLGRPVTQAFASFFLWEKLLNSIEFKRIIEFGTWRGNLSLYLFLFCFSKGAEFFTFDIKEYSSYKDERQKDILKEILNFRQTFKKLDIFENIELISSLIKRNGRTILFCDNGNKIDEFKAFAPFLKVGDIIGVHDWEIEIFPSDVKEIVERENLEPFFLKECREIDDSIRFWKKC